MVTRDSIDERSFVPAYLQLAHIIQNWVLKGSLMPGDRIPSESELCDRFGLSRMTVRRAISILTGKGILKSERGRGTFVSNPNTEGGLFVIPDFHEMLRSPEDKGSVKLLRVEMRRVRGIPGKRLKIESGSKALYMERVLEMNSEPLVFDRKYVKYDRSHPLLEAELGHGDLYGLFKNNPLLAPVRTELRLSATALKREEASLLLAKKGDPAFCLEQHIFAANDTPVTWGWLLYRGDRFSFESISGGYRQSEALLSGSGGNDR